MCSLVILFVRDSFSTPHQGRCSPTPADSSLLEPGVEDGRSLTSSRAAEGLESVGGPRMSRPLIGGGAAAAVLLSASLLFLAKTSVAEPLGQVQQEVQQ